MSDDEAAPAGGMRPEQLQDASAPRVVERKQPNIVEPPSLVVPAPAAGGRTGPQSPRWVLPVDVPVPECQETTVHVIPEVLVVEQPPAPQVVWSSWQATPEGSQWRCLEVQDAVTGGDGFVLHSQRSKLLRFRDSEGEVRGQGRPSCSLHP